MRLDEIPKNSKLKLVFAGQDGSNDREEFVTFHHCDGMYSLITTDDGDTLHLGRFTPMKKVDDYYEIDS